jgi:uncharacterized membrane protein
MPDETLLNPEPQTLNPAQSSWLISWPHLVLGLIGFGIAAYSLVVKRRLAAGEDSGCGISATINCDNVIGNATYGQFLHIPWGVWGMVFFVIVLLTAVNRINGESQSRADAVRQAALWQLVVATAGILTSVALTYISKAIIGVWCPVCMATHTVTMLLFVVSLVGWLKLRRATSGGEAR